MRNATRQIAIELLAIQLPIGPAIVMANVGPPASFRQGQPAAVTGFIGLYWGVRVVIQFVYFDRSDAPSGLLFRVAEFVLVGLFIFFTATYGYAVAFNIWGDRS